MRQSEFPIKTLKEAPEDELAVNTQLLIRAGFINKVGAGIYSYLPFGLRVLQKIEKIVREEIAKINGVEILLPSLHPKEYWLKTGRWQEFDALYRIKAHENREYALGPTHEEVVVPLAKHIIQSYKDLPLYLYQIQTKFRDEPRAKSGLLRGREFIMKDLYSFHKDEKDLEEYHEKVAKSYGTIFHRCGLDAIRTKASGGTFSTFSDEFQVLIPEGEDIIFYCGNCRLAWNKEIMKEGIPCPQCKKSLEKNRASEVGNTFKLGTKYSQPFDLVWQDEKGNKRPVIMGCYGIGISRLIGTIVEVHYDEKGIVWPDEVAPFKVHLIGILNLESGILNEIEKIYKKFQKANIEVLYDDRKDKTAGEKFVEADLIGIPWRIIVSERTVKTGKVEIKKRSAKEVRLVSTEKIIAILNSKF